MSSHLLRTFLALLLCGTGWASPRPFAVDYDTRDHHGVVVARSPEGEGFVLHRRFGRMVDEIVDLEVEGRPAWLLLWKGFPHGTERFPELWVLDPSERLSMVWPPDEEFYWISPRVTWLRPDPERGERLLEIRRALPAHGLVGSPAHLVERLRLGGIQGVTLASKQVETWTGERQLLSIVEDFLLTGESARIPELLATHRETQGELSEGAARRLVSMASRQAIAQGIAPKDLEAIVAPARSPIQEGSDVAR